MGFSLGFLDFLQKTKTKHHANFNMSQDFLDIIVDLLRYKGPQVLPHLSMCRRVAVTLGLSSHVTTL